MWGCAFFLFFFFIYEVPCQRNFVWNSLVSYSDSACSNFKKSWSGPWTTRAGSDKYTLMNLPPTCKINHAHYQYQGDMQCQGQAPLRNCMPTLQAHQLVFSKLAISAPGISVGNFYWENSDTILSEYYHSPGTYLTQSLAKTVFIYILVANRYQYGYFPKHVGNPRLFNPTKMSLSVKNNICEGLTVSLFSRSLLRERSPHTHTEAVSEHSTVIVNLRHWHDFVAKHKRKQTADAKKFSEVVHKVISR